MEDILDLYALPYDPRNPLLCFDETSKQLLVDSRPSLPVKPGHPARYDYQYRRRGTRAIFVAVEPRARRRAVASGRRFTTVRRRRTRKDFAQVVQTLLGKAPYRRARRIRIVLDNLNTHGARSFFQAFPRETAKRILRKLEFHYTPKHASWLNMAEIEMSILHRQCLARRIPTEKALKRALGAWQAYRNRRHATITWKFTRQDARRIFRDYYPT